MDKGRIESRAGPQSWQEYRRAFDDFCMRAHRIQVLLAQPNVDRVAVDAALLELEKARVLYNIRRDSLARKLSVKRANAA